MKSTKLVLILILCLHVICLLKANLQGLTFIDNADYKKNINPFGKAVNTFIKKIDMPENVWFYFRAFYATYSGTNRGYEFFSPNIPNTWIEFSYFANKKEIDIPLVSNEAKVKFFTSNFFLQKYFAKEKFRDRVLKSISMRLFSLDEKIREMEISITVNKIQPLNFYQSQNKMIARSVIPSFTLIRHD